MLRALLHAAIAATLAVRASAQDSTTGRPMLDRPLRAEISLLSRFLTGVDVPTAERFVLGPHDVTDSASGTVAVARGNLAVHAPIRGDALVLHGDLLLYPGGVVSGDAVAVDGRVRVLGGVVNGDVRSVRGLAGDLLSRAAAGAGDARPMTTWQGVKVVVAWFAILVVIGIGVLLFAERNLDGVVATLEQQFSRAFWVGILVELAALPALVIVVLGLTLSVIGILLIPFAVVASVVALAGLLMLGFLAVARFTGRGVFARAADSRATHLRSLFAGLVAYVGLWLVAVLFMWNPVAGSILRAVAVAGTWVAMTYGLGATILSRAGTLRDGARTGRRPTDELSWQTPTPVAGVAAARRPVATARNGA